MVLRYVQSRVLNKIFQVFLKLKSYETSFKLLFMKQSKTIPKLREFSLAGSPLCCSHNFCIMFLSQMSICQYAPKNLRSHTRCCIFVYYLPSPLINWSVKFTNISLLKNSVEFSGSVTGKVYNYQHFVVDSFSLQLSQKSSFFKTCFFCDCVHLSLSVTSSASHII